MSGEIKVFIEAELQILLTNSKLVVQVDQRVYQTFARLLWEIFPARVPLLVRPIA